jgi:hypothetical protein
MKRVGFGALLFCLGISAASAYGATVSFDFRGSTLPTNNTWADASSGVAVTATPLSTIAYQTGFPYLTDDPNKGLGVVSVKSILLPQDPLINVGESIKFSFSPTIEVRSIAFTELQDFWGFGDYVTLSYFDGTATQNLNAVRAQGSGPYDTYTYNLPTPVTAVTFTIGSGSQLLNSFGVAGITVDYTPGTDSGNDGIARSVDIPPSVWEGVTLLTALIGIRVWSRRRAAVLGA